jgi:hypothetical protein
VEESSNDDKKEPQWVQHNTSLTREKAELDSLSNYLIQQPIGIFAEDSTIKTALGIRFAQDAFSS